MKIILSLKELTDKQLKLFFFTFLALWIICGFLIFYLGFKNDRFIKIKSKEIAHSHNITYDLRDIRASWRKTEINAYGYLLTKSEDILKLYKDNLADLYLSIKNDSKFLSNNESRNVLYHNLWALIKNKMRKISWHVENYNINEIDTLFLDKEIEDQFSLIIYLESNLLHKKEHEFADARNLWIFLFIILCSLMFILFIFNFFIIKEAIHRHEFDTNLNNLNNFLESEINEKTLQLQESNKELESFSYSVSHDLRAPLRAIEGFCNILLEDFAFSLDPIALGYFEKIVENSKKMSKLIDDILSFSRTGRKFLEKVKINLNELVNNCIKEIKEEYKDKIYNIILHNLGTVSGDYSMIKQLFYNLISNAFKFSNKKEFPEIEIGYEISNNSERHKIYYVKDNGCGFDMRYKRKLFDVFQRLHSSAEFPGNGVGLAICKKIIEKHDGQIWAKSFAGQGSIFYFTIGEKMKSCNGGSSTSNKLRQHIK